MTFEMSSNESTPNKNEQLFQYWFKEYDDALREHNLFFLEKHHDAEANEYSIKFKRTVPAREFIQTGASWEDCFQAMLDEVSGWDEDKPRALNMNEQWNIDDVQQIAERGSEAYPEIKYAKIQEKALNNPTALTEEERKYFFDNIKEEDYELAADIKKLWESSKK